MVANRAASQVRARLATKSSGLDSAAVDHAIRLIHQVCCFAGSFDLVQDFRDQALCTAVERHDTAALFDRLIFDFSFQGISDQIAINYMQRHGQATWRSVLKNLAKRPSCAKLKTYWAFHDCGYEKTSRTCAEPDHIAACGAKPVLQDRRAIETRRRAGANGRRSVGSRPASPGVARNLGRHCRRPYGDRA